MCVCVRACVCVCFVCECVVVSLYVGACVYNNYTYMNDQ